MFYIIKQVLNEPPGWKEDTQVLDKVATKGTMFIWLSFCMCTRRKPPRDLEIEHVSRTVASVYSHMLNGLWLSQLHSGRPMHWHLQVNQNCVREIYPYIGAWQTSQHCVLGGLLWKDFVTFSICQYSILVSTYPAATGGIKMRLCHVGKVYNFCRR